ncbi:MAG TPA: hypothetical protein VKR24_12125, partial [Candidatus Limnocylindrales bacterium]|nr:hypothetical protein [Candidatus Limnocylindrales bacterium]
MADQDEVQLVFRAVDQMSDTLKSIDSQLGKMGGTTKETTSAVESLGSKIGSVAQAIKSGFGAALGIDIFQKLDQGVHDLIDAIPAAISAGNAYIDQVHQIGLETGMSATQSSLLLAAVKELGIPTDNLGQLLARLSLNLSNN